jgi:hypothetical protein
MPSGTWPLGWATGDIETAAEFKKGIGCISDTTLGGSAANIDITSIVATYAHLLIVTYARGDTAAGSIAMNMRFNNDTAANYDHQRLTGGGATPTAVESFTQTSMPHYFMPANTAGANLFSAHISFIPNYAGSTNNKLSLSVASLKTGTGTGGMAVAITGGFWRSNAAINRITLLPGAGNFVAGTRVTIYGMGA